ncbi:MAG: ATP-binding protein [Spirosomaceae bacterium]|nr:ATP-binding protein [Spirosomataceae bacterium]
MRRTLHIIFILIPFISVGQLIKITNTDNRDSVVYQIDSLKARGVLLNKGWKYVIQDNVAFAKPEFDDKQWRNIAIDDEFSEFPAIEKNTIGWFRKKIKIGDSLVNKPLIFSINIKGAAEIYLDGKKIHSLGKVGVNGKKQLLNFFKQPLPYSVMFDKAGEHTLAIRFVFSHTSKLFDFYDYFPLSIRFRSLDGYIESTFTDTGRSKNTEGIAVGFFLMMAFIHYFFYRFFRSKKFNLSFFFAMLFFGISFYFSSSTTFIYSNKAIFLYSVFLEDFTFVLAHLILLYAVYEFLNYPRRLLYSIAVFTIIFVKILTFFEFVNNYLDLVMYVGLLSNYIYLIWKAIKNKNPDGKVLRDAVFTFMAAIAFLIVLLIFISILLAFQTVSAQPIITNYWVPLFVNTFIVGPQLAVSGAISLSLAKEFVKTNSILKQKIDEIEHLSAEKQQILATQNEILEKQVSERTEELKKSLEELRETQDQLVQREKMASLGELTAGIAHEIQNPLNFVNNFSEVSKELIEELKEESSRPDGERDAGLEEEILSDIRSNLEKINHHGKRASNIVKGMLEHSRANSGERQSTDINALCDEYLRLSYHGLRAKDKSFNADFRVELDSNLPKVEVVSQDLGRVLLNMINNAFYAVQQKTKLGIDGYKPTVNVSTQLYSAQNLIEIRISDNGTGIPASIKAKIFQPFFTTKPTGEGTGLGLSLSYDIITKGHGGTLEVESNEGEGTTFIISLPFK